MLSKFLVCTGVGLLDISLFLAFSLLPPLVNNSSLAQAAEVETKKTEVPNDLAGFHFGTALSFTHDLSGSPRIKTATVVNGIVRVTEQQNDIPRLMLESHYFFGLDDKTEFCVLIWTGCISSTAKKWGWGPYVGVQPGTDNVIQAVAMGLMIGFKKHQEDTLSWNLGLGISVDPNVKVLGDGITRNGALPVGETEARLRTTSRAGLQIMFSVAF